MPDHPNYGKIIAHGWKRVLAYGLIALVLVGGLSFIEPLKYSSSIRLLIIQPSALGYDPYTAIRAAESVGDNLAQVVFTTDFYNRVISSKFNIDASYFPDNDAKRRKLWSNTVGITVERGTGLLNISVYHPDPDQATQIARAIAFVMTTEGTNYVGGTALQIRLVDDPLVSRFPVKPNILANAFTGFVLGAFFGVLYVIVTDKSRKYAIQHPPSFV